MKLKVMVLMMVASTLLTACKSDSPLNEAGGEVTVVPGRPEPEPLDDEGNLLVHSVGLIILIAVGVAGYKIGKKTMHKNK